MNGGREGSGGKKEGREGSGGREVRMGGGRDGRMGGGRDGGTVEGERDVGREK